MKIPCPGCGLTRATIALLQGDIIKSLQYHILAFPMAVVCFLYLLCSIVHKDAWIHHVLKKYHTWVIVSMVLLALVIEWINLNNPLLYEHA
ncbi:MAG: DUF2752 domain-containing protein [Erysipelotrichaceae bacterium]|nr:DUF2752 domain-containing protein [Erysipelotrichaceae bacterium]